MQDRQDVRYVTTAIVYPNSRIHVGWAWECLGADWLVRSLKMLGHHTFFATGMDEHSMNVQRAAEKAGLAPQAYCDQMADDIRKVLGDLGIQYDRFIRTSDADHKKVVTALVQRALDNGDVYAAKYEGLYCESCEAFYTDKDLVNGLCPTHAKAPKWISEENYFFKLSKYQDRLLEHFQNHPDFIQPEYRKAEMVHFIKSGLKDFSISRSTFTWGVPLPFDSKQVVYVWFDALINYVTAAGYAPHLKLTPTEEGGPDFEKVWPAFVHIVGKDITRFHTIYWPAMLMSLGLPLPKRVFAHGYIQIQGSRMSKSSGNVVAPDVVIAQTGPDPFRYYLLAENQFSQDGNFDLKALIFKNNADLANDWGNLVNRSITMTRKFFPNEELTFSKSTSLTQSIRDLFEALPNELSQAVDQIDPSAYAAACLKRSRGLNLLIDQTKPWALAKDTQAQGQENLREVIYSLLEGIYWLATAWSSFLPFKMPEVFQQLGKSFPGEQNAIKNLAWGKNSFKVDEPKPIYPRLDLPV